MPYNEPTPTEIKISQRLAGIMTKVEKVINKMVGAKCSITLIVSPRKGYQGNIVSYVSNVQRQSAAFMMAEMLVRWRSEESDTPAHLWLDDQGRTLDEVLGDYGPH